MKKIRIGNKFIGDGEPCFIIAEAGSNHNRNLGLAKRLIDEAAKAEADAVKFQTFTARDLYADLPEMRVNGRKKWEYISRYELPYEWHKELYQYAKKRSVCFLSTPFDEKAADLLQKIGVELFKVSSFELTNFPFLEYVAGKKRPMILSTGMANLREIKEATQVIREKGKTQFAILHCGSSYPLDFNDVNLRAIGTLKKKFDVPTGYSDHTLGIEVPIAAVALGANIIEKHFTMSRSYEGPDHKFSIEPGELADMVRKIRNVERSLGSPVKKLTESEKRLYRLGRRSIFAVKEIKKGQAISKSAIAILRPNFGMHPKYFNEVCKKKAKVDITPYTPIAKNMLY